MLKDFFQRISWYIWSPMGILCMLSAIFYTILHFYAVNALQDAPQVTVALVDKIASLRMLFSGLFCVFLGYIGVRLSGHIWPAMLVHTVVVFVLLALDLSLSQMWQHWQITLLILAAVAAITGLASTLTLGLFWFKMKFPRKRR